MADAVADAVAVAAAVAACSINCFAVVMGSGFDYINCQSIIMKIAYVMSATH